MKQQMRDREINLSSLEPRSATANRPAIPSPVDVGSSRIITRRSQRYFSSMSREPHSEVKPNANFTRNNTNTTVQAKCLEYTTPLEANEKYIRHIYTARGLQPSGFRPRAVSKLYNRSAEVSKIILSCNPEQQCLEKSIQESNTLESATGNHIDARPICSSRKAKELSESRYSPERRPELDVSYKAVVDHGDWKGSSDRRIPEPRLKIPCDLDKDKPNRIIDEKPNKYEDRTVACRATENSKKVQGVTYGVGYSNMYDRVLPSSFLPPQLTAPAIKVPNQNTGHNQRKLGHQESEEGGCPELAKHHFTQLSSSVFKALPLNGTKTRSVFEAYKMKHYDHDASSAPATMFKLRETHKPMFLVNRDSTSNKQVFLGKRHFDTSAKIVRDNSGLVGACKRFECAGTFKRREEGTEMVSAKERFNKQVPKGAIVSKDYEGFKKYWSFTDTFDPKHIVPPVQPCYYMEMNVHRSDGCGKSNKGILELFHNEKYDETSASSLPFVSLPPSKTQMRDECTTKRRPNAVVCKDHDLPRTTAPISNHQAEHPSPMTRFQQRQGNTRRPLSKNRYDSTVMRDALYWPEPDVHEPKCPGDQHGVGDKRDVEDNTRKRAKQSWVDVSVTHTPQEEKCATEEDGKDYYCLAKGKDCNSKASPTVCIQRKIPSTYAFAYTKPIMLSGLEDPETLSFRPNIKKQVDNFYHGHETINRTRASVKIPKEMGTHRKTTRMLSNERTNKYCLLPTVSLISCTKPDRKKKNLKENTSINLVGTKNAYCTRDKSNNSRRPLSGLSRGTNEQDKHKEELRRIQNIIDSRSRKQPLKLTRISEVKKLNAHETVQNKRECSLDAKSRNGANYRAHATSNSYHATKENVRQIRKAGNIHETEKKIRWAHEIKVNASVSGALLKSTFKNDIDTSNNFANNTETIIGRSRSKQTKIERPSDGKRLTENDVNQSRHRNVSIESKPTRDYNTRNELGRNRRPSNKNVENMKNSARVFDSEKTKKDETRKERQLTKLARATRLSRNASATKYMCTSAERNVDSKPRPDPEHDSGVRPSKEERDQMTTSTALEFSRLSLHYQQWLASPQSSTVKTKFSRKIIQRFKNTMTKPMALPTVPGKTN